MGSLSKRIVFVLCFLLGATISFCQLNLSIALHRGKTHIQNHRYVEGIGDLSLVLAVDSSQDEAWFFRGYAKYELGDLSGALRDLREAVYIRPFYPKGHFLIGFILKEQGKWSEAENAFRTTCEQEPEHVSAPYLYCVSLLAQEDWERSEFLVDSFLENNQSSKDLIRLKVLINIETEDWKEAEALALYALEQSDEEATRLLLVELYIRQNLPNLAKPHLEYILNEIDSVHMDALYGLSWCYFSASEWDKAEEYSRKTLEVEPYHLRGLLLAARISKKRERYQEGLDWLKKLEALAPTHIPLLQLRAQLYQEKGDYKNAYLAIAQGLEYIPELPDLHDLKTYFLSKQGKHASAKQSAFQSQQGKIVLRSLPINQLAKLKKDFMVLPSGSPLERVQKMFLEEELRLTGPLYVHAFLPEEDRKVKSSNVFTPDWRDSLLEWSAVLLRFPELDWDSEEKMQTLENRANISEEIPFVLFQNQERKTARAYLELLRAGGKVSSKSAFLEMILDIDAVEQRFRGASGMEDVDTEQHLLKAEESAKQCLKYPEIQSITLFNYAILKAYQRELFTALYYFEVLEKSYSLNPLIYYNMAILHYKTGSLEQCCYFLSKSGALGYSNAYDDLRVLCGK